MADHDLNPPGNEGVYPNANWVPCTSSLTIHRSSGSPENDDIVGLQQYIHPSARRKYKSYPCIGNVASAELSRDPPRKTEKQLKKKQLKKKQLKKEGMLKWVEKIRYYAYLVPKMTNVTQIAKNTLFVGRLSYETTAETLIKEFRHFGEILDVKLVRDLEGRSRGYAFIEFSTLRGQRNAFYSTSKKVIDGREVLIDVERGRLDKGWLPRRLGGGLGVKPEGKTSKKSPGEVRKKKKAKARKGGVTDDKNTKDSENKQGSQEQLAGCSKQMPLAGCSKQKPLADDLSTKLEAVSISKEGSQEKNAAKKGKKKKNLATETAVQPSESTTSVIALPAAPASTHHEPASDNQTHLAQQISSSVPESAENSNAAGEENISHCRVQWVSHQPGHYASTFHHQGSTTVPPNYVEIPAASDVHFHQPHYSQQEPYYPHDPTGFQQPAYHNPAIVHGYSTAPEVHYYPQPISGITYQSYPNVSHSSHECAAHQFQNSAAASYNHQPQSPTVLILQPAHQNLSYPEPTSHTRFLPQENYQAPTVFHQVQQSVPQSPIQPYQNNQVLQSIPQASHYVTEDNNYLIGTYGVVLTYPAHPTEQPYTYR